MFNKLELKFLGCIKVEIFNFKNGQCFFMEYIVVLIGYIVFFGVELVQQFGFIVINIDNIMFFLNEIFIQLDFVSKFGDVFLGEGKFKGKFYFEIDKFVIFVVLLVRKVFFVVKEFLKQELECLVKIGIL